MGQVREKKPTTKKAPAPDKQFGIRIPGEMWVRLERHRERMRKATPGAEITITDAIRNLLSVALDIEEN
jgi:hypothetical protein